MSDGWESRLVKFLKSPVFDFWLPRRAYVRIRDKALNQEHLAPLLRWAYEEHGPRFTRTEIKLFYYLKFCLPDKEIADRLNIAPGTVRLHVHNLLRKANCRSRHELLFSEHFFKDRFPYFNLPMLEKDPVALSRSISSLLQAADGTRLSKYNIW